MTAPKIDWAVTEIAHPAVRDVRDDCEDCLALVDDAIATARATGSVGANVERHSGEELHSVSVRRAIAVITR